MRKIFQWAATVFLAGVIVFCLTNIWDITAQYRQESALHDELLAFSPQRAAARPDDALNPIPYSYKRDDDAKNDPTMPDITQGAPSDDYDTPVQTSKLKVFDPAITVAPPSTTEPPPLKPNQGIIDLQQRNEDVVGWLTIPDTKIDYPFAQANNNDHYLSRNIYGKYAAAGTLFLDYRNEPDFSDFNNIIYGHFMRNGSVFGTLHKLTQKAFFEEHPIATLYLDYHTYELEIIAAMTVSSGNTMIYRTHHAEPEVQQKFFEYIAEHARRYRDIGLAQGDKIVTMSTCAYQFDDARTVVIARLKEVFP